MSPFKLFVYEGMYNVYLSYTVDIISNIKYYSIENILGARSDHALFESIHHIHLK